MRFWLTALVLICLPMSSANARNILLTNDDGLTSDVVALYLALKAEGHDVIVSVPCQGQSGMGAAIKFLRPLGPLTEDCLNDAARKGDPGAGPMTRPGVTSDFHYVDGTPVMATLFGLDVLSKARWGNAPDLLLSGPNEGQNVGPITITSGTVSNAQYGLARGIPSIALSAGANTAGGEQLNNPASKNVAELTITLLRALENGSGNKPLLPRNLALNVNVPDNLEDPNWQLSRIGTFEQYKVGFVSDMSKSPVAVQFGLSGVRLPGIVIDMNKDNPSSAQTLDESVVFKTKIAISPMQLGYEPALRSNRWLKKVLGTLIVE